MLCVVALRVSNRVIRQDSLLFGDWQRRVFATVPLSRSFFTRNKMTEKRRNTLTAEGIHHSGTAHRSLGVGVANNYKVCENV